ncbi:20702_t:CDS:2, partial [Racocetra persica]
EYKIKLETTYKSLSEGRKNKSISLKKAYDLVAEIMKEGKDLTKQETDKDKTHPTKEEFEMIKKLSGNFVEFFTDIREEYPSIISDKLYSDLKEEVKELEDFIKQEEEHQKSPSGNGNGNDTNNNDNTGNNDNSNGSKGSGRGKKPSSSNNSELEEKIKDLQNQLSAVKQELEKKQQQNPNSIDSQQEERKKDELERELERLKREKEENERRSRSQNPQKDSFPYGLVIDIYPPRSLIYQKIQQIVAEILHQNNYQPAIFPAFEAKELFTTSLGSTTDIIHKEMYTFADRKGRELVLRPEGTASM